MARLNDSLERLAHLLQFGWKAECGLGVVDRRADRLFHFMSNRGRELTHGGDAIGVRTVGARRRAPDDNAQKS